MSLIIAFEGANCSNYPDMWRAAIFECIVGGSPMRIWNKNKGSDGACFVIASGCKWHFFRKFETIQWYSPVHSSISRRSTMLDQFSYSPWCSTWRCCRELNLQQTQSIKFLITLSANPANCCCNSHVPVCLSISTSNLPESFCFRFNFGSPPPVLSCTCEFRLIVSREMRKWC